MKRSNKKLICAVLLLLLIFNAAACASKNTGDRVSKRASTEGAYNNSLQETYAASDDDYMYEEAVPATGADMTIDGGSIVNNSPEPYDPSEIPVGNMLIRTVTMTITTENFDTLSELIRTSVSENGGYFENMSISGTGTVNDYKRGTFVIRVPADNLDSLSEALSGSGTVISSNETTEDVTLDYVDIESHISALRTEQESLMALLEEAEDLETIVQLENYLAGIRYEIENYESQARTMSNLVQYATLTINLQEVVTEEPPVEIDEVREETLKTRISNAFNDSMKSVKEGGKDLLVYIAGDLPYLCVRLIVLGTIFIIGFGTFKCIKKRKAKKLALAKAAEAPSGKTQSAEK